jgi:imidazolonepropionase-like amidohydrolase
MKGLLPGARMYSAGFGFGVPQGGPSVASAMDLVNRPENAEQAIQEVDSLHALGIGIVKIWVDDFNGTSPKMTPDVYEAIISRAHQYGMRVASHLYYLEDAQKLVAAGVDIIAHSIRDKDIDDQLLLDMKQKGTSYIPTLSLDEFAFIYARQPEWIDDPFFKASLEPGVYEMITSESYINGIKNSPVFEKNEKAFQTALRNLQRIFAAGIPISLGTDSGATPIRAQGFSEHLELELMVQAGLTPLEAIIAGTRTAATLLHINERYGTIEKGKSADFLILSGDPSNDIRKTRGIEEVWKGGVKANRE